MIPPNHESIPAPSRREFARIVALATATGLIGIGDQSPAAAQEPRPSGAELAPLPAEELLELVRLRYPNHLSEDELSSVRTAIEGHLRTADRLAKFPLKNGDEPAIIFSALVS